MPDRKLIRNYLVFFVSLVSITGMLIFALIDSNKDMAFLDKNVAHTYEIIYNFEQISALIEGTLSAQRAYIITGKDSDKKEYIRIEKKIYKTIDLITALTIDNPVQTVRLKEIKNYMQELSQETNLNNTILQDSTSITSKRKLANIRAINFLKSNIFRIVNSVLAEEYKLLNLRVAAVVNQKANYFLILLVGLVVTSAVLIIFNGVVLTNQRRRTKAEFSLRNAEQRLAMAIDGTQDGIFDWEIDMDRIFYSKRMFEMLGYEDAKNYYGKLEDYTKIIHPEDIDKVMAKVDDFLAGRIPEYNNHFRVKAADGTWLWIRSKGKLVKDDKGKNLRLIGGNSDITLLKEKEQRLEFEKAAAETANRAKTDFLAHMSHEIRTPLTAISGIAEIFLDHQENLNARQINLVSTLNSSATALRNLIDDILDFSRIESGEITLNEEEFLLDELFQTIISIMNIKASEKVISFILDYSAVKGRCFVGDRGRINQILVNLIGNAIKFTDQGSVTVNVFDKQKDDQNYLCVEVMDTGVGISPQKFDIIFERFKQADSSVSRKFGGTGLGLPISRNLAHLMGGDIFVNSQVDYGSTFILMIPDRQNLLQENPQNDLLIDKEHAQYEALLTIKNKKVLIVEDYENNIIFLSYLIEEVGLSYILTNNGQEALTAFKAGSFDLVLMDIQMPVMDGFSATKAIRLYEQEQGLIPVPIIAMTAHALVSDRQKCVDVGMNGYLSKPFTKQGLRETLLKYLA